MSVVSVIDYGVGNLFSVRHAVSVAARNRDVQVRIDSDPHALVDSDAIILPGVGHFDACARSLRARHGMIAAMTRAVFDQGAPFLGICVGMQLIVDRSDEGSQPGLGWIAGETVALGASERIPHMGWNTITGTRTALFDRIETADVYFAHSFVVRPESPDHIAATCRYGGNFVAAIADRRIFGVQFHPEKSQMTGQTVLDNFLRMIA